MRPDDSLASGLFPDGVVACLARLDSDAESVATLPPEEASAVDGAHPRRRAEFALGRVLARRALDGLGVPVTALGRDPDRVPRWPEEVVGCISHTRRAPQGGSATGDAAGLVGAAVARASAVRAIGLDLEPHRPPAEGIVERVCFGEELDWVGAGHGDPDAAGRRCRAVFSIKEAVYKAFYPTLREVWGFDRVAVRVDLDAERFVAAVPASTGCTEVAGRIRIRDGWILSTLVVPVGGG